MGRRLPKTRRSQAQAGSADLPSASCREMSSEPIRPRDPVGEQPGRTLRRAAGCLPETVWRCKSLLQLRLLAAGIRRLERRWPARWAAHGYPAAFAWDRQGSEEALQLASY